MTMSANVSFPEVPRSHASVGLRRDQRDFHALLYEAYVLERAWSFRDTRSGIHVRDRMLLDDFCAEEHVQTVYLDGVLALGFRILDHASELRRYPHCIPPRYLDSCIEGNRIVVKEGYRGVHLTQLVGKRAFDHCQAHGFRYAIFCGTQPEMNRRMRRFPGATVIPGGIEYPEGPADVSIFDTHSLALRSLYHPRFFQAFLGWRMAAKVQRGTARASS